MWYGWTGNELEIDLSRGNIEKRQGNREIYETYLTGRGLIAKLFWDRVPPETDAFSSDNLLVFGVAPLVGTNAPAANQTSLFTISPMTNYLGPYGTAGFWGPELKFAGYDTLIISGKSAYPVYVYINNDKVELRDASHLWGKNIHETQQMIREELKDKNIQSLCIGPAGENRVYFASIEHGQGHSFSRRGPGAVMGDKKLKAIAVRGTQDVNIANPTSFSKLCDEIIHRSDSRKLSEFFITERDRTDMRSPNMTYYRNFELMKPWPDVGDIYMGWLKKRGAIYVGCFNCPWKCRDAVQLPDGQQAFMQCRSRYRFTNASDIQDFDFNLRCASLVQSYGFDILTAAATCSFAIDLYQRGILTREDTDGMHLEWGNPEVIPALLEKIAYRNGIGDVLADGVYRAAQRIGRGAEQYACHTRKNEPRGTNLERDQTYVAKQLLSDRQDANQSHGYYRMLSDCAGICAWVSNQDGTRPVPVKDRDKDALISYATGLDLGKEGLTIYIKRTKALLRAYNSILGERQTISDLDTLLPDAEKRFPPEVRAKINQMVTEQNQELGFTPDGIPTEETLEKLDLPYVAEEMKRRGILQRLHTVKVP